MSASADGAPRPPRATTGETGDHIFDEPRDPFLGFSVPDSCLREHDDGDGEDDPFAIPSAAPLSGNGHRGAVAGRRDDTNNASSAGGAHREDGNDPSRYGTIAGNKHKDDNDDDDDDDDDDGVNSMILGLGDAAADDTDWQLDGLDDHFRPNEQSQDDGFVGLNFLDPPQAPTQPASEPASTPAQPIDVPPVTLSRLQQRHLQLQQQMQQQQQHQEYNAAATAAAAAAAAAAAVVASETAHHAPSTPADSPPRPPSPSRPSRLSSHAGQQGQPSLPSFALSPRPSAKRRSSSGRHRSAERDEIQRRTRRLASVDSPSGVAPGAPSALGTTTMTTTTQSSSPEVPDPYGSGAFGAATARPADTAAGGLSSAGALPLDGAHPVLSRRDSDLLAVVRGLERTISTLDVSARLCLRDALVSLSHKASNPHLQPTPEQEAMNRAAEYLVLRMLFLSGQQVMHTAPGTATATPKVPNLFQPTFATPGGSASGVAATMAGGFDNDPSMDASFFTPSPSEFPDGNGFEVAMGMDPATAASLAGLQGRSLSAGAEMATGTGAAAAPSGLRGRTSVSSARQSGSFRPGKTEAIPLAVPGNSTSDGPQSPRHAAVPSDMHITPAISGDGVDSGALSSAVYSPLSTIAPPGPPVGLASTGVKRSRELSQGLSSGVKQEMTDLSSPSAFELDTLLNDGMSG